MTPGDATTLRLERVTFAAGGFRGLETQFQSEHPLVQARSGYMGGDVADPTPEAVASGHTGHAEVVEVTFDADVVPLRRLLEIWWTVHDATLSPPRRHRYRSAVFCYSAEQEKAVKAWLAARQDETAGPILTDVLPATRFWSAPAELQRWIEKTGAVARRLKPLELTKPVFEKVPVDMSAYDPDVVVGAGAAFSGHFHTDSLRQAFCGPADFVAGALAEMRESLASAGVDGAGASGATYPLTGSSTMITPWAAEGRAQWSFPGVDHTFIASLDGGNFLPRLDVHHWQTTRTSLPAAPAPLDGPLTFVGPREFPTIVTMWQQPGRIDRGPQLAANDRSVGLWHEHVPPLEVELDVGEAKPHRLRWAGGRLFLDSHRGPIERARTLSVLGGRVCPCFHVLDLWRPEWIEQRWHERAAINMLSRSSRALTPPEATAEPVAGEAPGQWARDSAEHGDSVGLPDLDAVETGDVDEQARQAVADLVTTPLAQLPVELQRRWLLGAVAHLDSHRAPLDRGDRLTLEAIFLGTLRAAATGSLWQWCRHHPTISTCAIACRFLNPDEPATAHGCRDGGQARLAVAAPFRWLTHVWARGLAIIDDELILDVDGPADAHELAVTAVAWRETGDGTPAVLMTRTTTAHWDGDEWHLATDG